MGMPQAPGNAPPPPKVKCCWADAHLGPDHAILNLNTRAWLGQDLTARSLEQNVMEGRSN